ncbi:MAG: hypothetical protein J6A08_05770 [Lachnospiraceae bacterium]|nr:hypothetical protein [Lachnospiraceae bacterium]
MKTTKRNTIKKKRTKPKKAAKRKTGISIKCQLVIGFLIPIIFVIIVGISGYGRAASGMRENYENSAKTAMEMSVSCLNQAFKPIATNILTLSSDTNISGLLKGSFDKNTANRSFFASSASETFIVAEGTDTFIQNIHMVPAGSGNCVTTVNLQNRTTEATFIDALKASETEADMFASSSIYWGSYHPTVDKHLDTTEDDYAVYCSIMTGSRTNPGVLIIDISRQAIVELLEQMDFGEGSLVFFLTPENRIIQTGDASIDLLNADFYQNLSYGQAAESGTSSLIAEYVTYDNKEYYFLTETIASNNCRLAVLVPRSTITAKADHIKVITIVMVLLATVVAVMISTYIVLTIGNNINKSVNRLDEVSKGNLIMKEEKQRKDEFGKIQTAISRTILHTRKLIESVNGILTQLAASSQTVSGATNSVTALIDKISAEMDGIDRNISHEADEIHLCRRQMEELSGKIKLVDANTGEIADQINDTQTVLQDSIEAMSLMTSQSKDTYDATSEVKRVVGALESKLVNIANFADAISSIARQTNLLSLNASIEAARAGEFGRGFSVVAAEIRKLSEDSAATAAEIMKETNEIRSYTVDTVKAVQTAEEIVNRQEATVANTEYSFRQISSFVDQFIQNISIVAASTKEMDSERKQVLSSMQNIQQLSQYSVASAEAVKVSLDTQIEASKELSRSEEELNRHMQELEEAISSFRI